MTPYPERIIINGATSQYDRWLHALDSRYAEVDGRSITELLDFGVEFGSLVNFYNLDNKIDGDWTFFFLSDPAMILAVIGSNDLAEIRNVFARLERLTKEARPFERQFEFLRDTFGVILGLARLINSWLNELEVSDAGEAAELLAQAIIAEIENDLGGQLRLLKAYDEGADLRGALGRPIGLNYDGFLKIWDLNNICPDGSIYRGRTDSRKVVSALPYLVQIFDSFLSALSELQRLAINVLPGIFKEANHKPQIALYIAFIELFRTAQDTINTFSSRYLDFYYREVLRERNRGPVPDNVYLTFTLAEDEGLLSAPVPAGTIFLAGQDSNGQDLLYASDKGLTVAGATITNLQMLRVERGSLFAPWSNTPPQVMRRVFASVVDAARATDATSPGERTEWVTFGKSEVGTTGIQVTELTTFGFAIATPYLLLTGGARLITLSVVYTSTFKEKVLDPLLAALSAVTGLSPEEILAVVLQEAFTLYASTPTGWLRVETYTVHLSHDPAFGLEFELPPSVSPIAPYDAAEGPENEATDNLTNPAPTLPTLKIYLRQTPISLGIRETVEVFPLSLLGEMEVAAFRIEVDVSELSDVQIENSDGAVDTSTPFYLLGAVPVLGSYALIRHQELFVKTIDRLQLAVSWFNLPQNEDGFAGYYKYYVIGPDGRRQPDLFDNQSFHISIGVRNPGRWFIQGGSPPCILASLAQADAYLFRTQPYCDDPVPSVDGALCSYTSFDDIIVCPAVPPLYYDPATSALKLELIAPSYAFGNSLYAQNVLNSVIEDLPDPLCVDEGKKKELRFPNEPYVPVATSLTVNYRASCTVEAGSDTDACAQIFHLLPFGGYEPVKSSADASMPLLPQFTFAGSFYLGFSRLVPPQNLTMLFQLAAGGGESPPVAWEYLSENRWHLLSSTQVRSDTTNGLQNSGVVTLALPSYDPAGNTLLPPGGQWLRACVAERPESFPDTTGIYPHVVLCTWYDNDNTGEHLRQPLSPHTINSSVTDLPGIDSINQPIESFGGRPPETDRAFVIRVGERLRHKDRAILGWDYERLVLERFPTVWKVQALPARTPHMGDSPGDVLVVIVPGPDGISSIDPTTPFAASDLLYQIKTYLEERTSQFVQLHVVNPNYVRIGVSTSVQFRDDEDPGADIVRLNNELVKYLSPWFFDAARAARGGSYASESDISEFIQTRPYVKAMDLISFRYEPEPQSLDWYFLTSARQHWIQEV